MKKRILNIEVEHAPGKHCCMLDELKTELNEYIGKTLTEEELINIHKKFETRCTKIYLTAKEVANT